MKRKGQAFPIIEYLLDSGKSYPKNCGLSRFRKEALLRTVIVLGADAYITGDLGHHDAVDALGEGLSLLNAGHYGLERFFRALYGGADSPTFFLR